MMSVILCFLCPTQPQPGPPNHVGINITPVLHQFYDLELPLHLAPLECYEAASYSYYNAAKVYCMGTKDMEYS